MRKIAVVAFVLAVALPGCTRGVEVGSDPNPGVLSTFAGPAGSYEFVLEAGNGTMPGSLELRSTSDGPRGTMILTDVAGQGTITGGTIDGRDVTLQVDTPDGPATVEIEFESTAYDEFTGVMVIGQNAIDIRGSRQQ